MREIFAWRSWPVGPLLEPRTGTCTSAPRATAASSPSSPPMRRSPATSWGASPNGWRSGSAAPAACGRTGRERSSSPLHREQDPAHDAEDDLPHEEFMLDQRLNPLYEAAIEATEEAILNSLCHGARDGGRERQPSRPPLPLDEVKEIVQRFGAQVAAPRTQPPAPVGKPGCRPRPEAPRVSEAPPAAARGRRRDDDGAAAQGARHPVPDCSAAGFP